MDVIHDAIVETHPVPQKGAILWREVGKEKAKAILRKKWTRKIQMGEATKKGME